MSIRNTLDFIPSGTPGAHVYDHDTFVAVDLFDVDERFNTFSVFVDKEPFKLRELARELRLITDLLLGIAEELEEPEADDSNALPATDPAAYPELSMEVDGQDNCPCDDCDKQEGVLGAGTAPDKWVPDCDETAKQFTQEADATVESVRVDNGV